MCQGRCAGCGYVGPDGKVRDHQMGCPDFAELYRKDPAAIGTVQQEYAKWVAEGRPAAKAAAHAQSVAETDARRAAMSERFKTRDVLDDDLRDMGRGTRVPGRGAASAAPWRNVGVLSLRAGGPVG